MGILTEIFGESGFAMQGLAGQWYLVGIFIFIFFILFLFRQGVNAKGITFFTMLFLLLVMQEGLFGIPIKLITTVIFFILLFVSFSLYFIFNK